MPLRAGANFRGPACAGFDDTDGTQAAGVDDHAALDLRLPEVRRYQGRCDIEAKEDLLGTSLSKEFMEGV